MMSRKMVLVVTLCAISCGSGVPDETEAAQQMLVGVWKQTDPRTGALKVQVTFREDGTFTLDASGAGLATMLGRYSVNGQTLTVEMSEQTGGKAVLSIPFFVTPHEFAAGEGVLVPISRGAGIAGKWSGFERQERFDAQGQRTYFKNDSSEVTVRSDWSISLRETTTKSGTPASSTMVLDGTIRETGMGRYEVTWTSVPGRPAFAVRLFENGFVAQEKDIFSR